MKKLITITLIFVSLLSCENNDDIIADDLPRLVRLTNSGLQGNDIVFEYGQNGYLRKVDWGANHVNTFRYNSENQLVEVFYGDENSTTPITYVYQNNRIVGRYVDDEPESYPDTYIYNDNGQLTQIQDPNGEIVGTFYNYDAFGNIFEKLKISRFYTTFGEAQVYASYEYDDKINPFQFMFPEAFNNINDIVLNNLNSSINNRTSYTYTQYENGIGHVTHYEYVYEYNDSGLPISSIVTRTESGSSFTAENEFVYE